MTMKKQLLYAILTAILAGVVTYVTQAMSGWPIPACAGNGLTYICFICWACYFVCGCNVKGAINWFLSMAAGVVAGILMFVLTFAFQGAMGYLLAVSVAVVILVIFMMFYDRVKLSGAGVFVGTGLFFSLNAAGALTTFTVSDYLLVGGTELLYAAIGLVAGWLTIWFSSLVTRTKGGQ